MNQPPSPDDLARVVNALRQHEHPTITGAVLGTLVKRVAPGLNLRAAVDLPVGTGALAKFVDRYLTKYLKKTGQTATDGTGGDNIYELLRNDDTSELPQESPPSVSNYDYWNAFVRPADKRVLVAVRLDDRPTLRFSDEADAAGGTAIPKITQDEFKHIAEEFIGILESGSSTEDLATSLRAANSYNAFVQLLRDAGAAYFVRWSTHRRERLRRMFLSRIEVAGFNLTEQQVLLGELDRSQEIARQEIRQKSFESTTESGSSYPASRALAQKSETSVQFARELLKLTIDRMSIDEIRGIPISFGHLIDVFQSRIPK